MSDPHLLELQGRLKRVLLETRLEDGYDRQASHCEGRYVPYAHGLRQNTHLLEIDAGAQAFAELAVEQLLNAVTLADLERLTDALVRRGEPLLQPGDLVGAEIDPDLVDVVDPAGDAQIDADTCNALDLTDATVDALALQHARAVAEASGLPVPQTCDEIKLGYWRRKALAAIWAERPNAA